MSTQTHESVEVRIPADGLELHGELEVPPGAQGLVIFAHGSGSGRHSPRNQFVARQLRERSLGTLLMDLLSQEEDRRDAFNGHLRFDVELLAGRLVAAVRWAAAHPPSRDLRIGAFGASTGAAAALIAAARIPEHVKAVVSRGGRPDLAGRSLARVQAPTLLIVGGADPQVLELNRAALTALVAEKRMEVVPGASHLFEEPGTLEQVAELAADWFMNWLSRAEAAGQP